MRLSAPSAATSCAWYAASAKLRVIVYDGKMLLADAHRETAQWSPPSWTLTRRPRRPSSTSSSDAGGEDVRGSVTKRGRG